jgi:hypothetical protein
MRFGGHSINWEANPYGAIITLDSPETNQDVIAHELMHGWLGIVEGYEDRRMYRDRTDHAAMFLVDSTQCMVLDCMVQEAIGARGFDPCFWTAEIVDCLYEDGVALAHDIYPVTAYEASFAAKLYAWPEAVPHLFRFNSALAEKYIMARNMIREKMPDLARLGDRIARAFREGSYRTNEDAHRLIDRCLLLMADYVGMDFDLDRDLEIWQPPEPKWVDKFPSMFPGWPVELKYEVHRRLIRDGWPTGTLIQATGTAANSVQVTFHPSAGLPEASGASMWEWQSPRPLALPSSPSRFGDVLARSSPAARMRPRPWELPDMGNPMPPSSHARGPATPRIPTIPGVPQPSSASRQAVLPSRTYYVEPTLPSVPPPFGQSTSGIPNAASGPGRPEAPGDTGPERPAFRLSPDDEPFRPRRGGPTMRHYLPGLGRFISRVHLHQAVAMGRTTYEELREEWGINIGPLGTAEAFARNGVSEHPYDYSENNPVNMADSSGEFPTALVAQLPAKSSSGKPGRATYYDNVGCGACRTTGKCKCCKNSVPTGPGTETCYKNVYLTPGITGVAAVKASDPAFNCWDIVKVEQIDANGNRTGRTVTVTIVDTGTLANAILDLRPADMQTLTGSATAEAARVIATRIGHGWPNASKIRWASNTCRRRVNKPASDCA